MGTGKVFLWAILVLLIAPYAHGQTGNGRHYALYLRNGTIHPAENVRALTRSAFRTKSGEKRFVIVQFNDIPSEETKQRLLEGGVELLEYIPEYAYTATLTGEVSGDLLAANGVRSVVEPEAEQKLQPELLASEIPPHAQTVPGKVDVRLSYLRSFSAGEVNAKLSEAGIETLSDALKDYQIVEVRVDEARLKELAAMNFVQYIEIIPGEDQPLNDKSTANTRANVLTSPALAGKGLSGKGVVVGIGDVGNPMNHIDLSERIVEMTSSSNSSHGVHVTGTAAGSGIVNEKYAGYAPKASVLFFTNSQIWNDAPDLVRDFGMVITSNSYASGAFGTVGCNQFGLYSSDSYILDRQAFDMPYLQHVFAAGNSGQDATCTLFPAGFGNVLSEYASAKNVISVGQTLTTGIIAAASSKGPVRDGRVKPEITAPGTNIYSTIPTNSYTPGTGTSMAAPAVSGGLALLYERYRQLNGQTNPKSALMKAILCNGATDQGTDGPDYSYGFGNMNLLRSYAMLDQGHYVRGEVTHRTGKTHSITVPANTARLKVMLYWHDPAASILSGEKTLVNDLNLSLTPSGSAALLPAFPLMSAPAGQAVTGVDTTNNMEQIVIENPAAGSYEIKVFADKIPSGTQEYFVVYDFIEPATTITYPIGKEHLVRNDVVNIDWDSWGNSTSTFGVYYSLNNGMSWATINASLPATARQVSWTVPDAATGTAKVRVKQNDTGVTSDSEAFSILGTPTATLSSVQCESYIGLQWTAVSGATDYEVMILRDGEMKSVGVTTALTYTFSGLSRDSLYYVAVRARKDGIPGRRSLAMNRKPNTGTCAGPISNNDLALDAIISPGSSGRLNTSNVLSASTRISIRIKNLDDQVCTPPFEVGYAIGDDSAPVHWETVQDQIPALGSLDYTFVQAEDLGNVGNYRVRVWVKKTNDPTSTNNYLEKTFRQNANPALVLPYFEDVETLADQSVSVQANGIAGSDAYDFQSSAFNGRLRTSAGPGIAYSGTKAFTMDVGVFQFGTVNTNFLTGTYNLSSYDVAKDELTLSFRYRNHGQEPSSDNAVYVRGSDHDEWISAYNLFNNQNGQLGGYKLVSIPLSEVLAKSGQQFSPSSQVRWSQTGDGMAISASSRQGYSFDDIRLVKRSTDVELMHITAPVPVACGSVMSGMEIVVRNNDSEDVYSVQYKFNVNGSPSDEGWIASIPANSEVTVKVSPNIRAMGPNRVDIEVIKAYDVQPGNNSGSIVINRLPTVSAYPYLENFESGGTSWQGYGTNSSWTYGTPDSPGLRRGASGTKAWKTGLTGNYNAGEVSYLYSPCFSFSSMTRPMVSFSAKMNLAPCQDGKCDVVYIEYQLPNGTWNRLGEAGGGTNWYNGTDGGLGVWKNIDDTRWHVCSSPLPDFYYEYVMFRIVFKSGGNGTAEGIAIDDFHIYDMVNDIYEGGAEAAASNANAQGEYWSHFTQNQRLIASIYRDQDLGNVTVKSYLNGLNVKSYGGFYYLDRNYIIKPEKGNYPDSVRVRLYFTDTELKRLLDKIPELNVEKPQSAYELAITKYSGTREDDDLLNNATEGWAYYPSTKIAIVPYGKGYYAEFKTRTFSEFWLAKGNIGFGSALPVTLVSFSAQRKPTADAAASVELRWTTASEKDFDSFEIEMAEGDLAVSRGLFSKIGTIAGAGGTGGQHIYTFTHRMVGQLPASYYRLKMIDTDGSYHYSAIRAVAGDGTAGPVVFPNPSAGRFELDFQHTGKDYAMRIYDFSGRLVKSENVKPTGRPHAIDLSAKGYPAGLYLIEIVAEDRKYSLKVAKE